ncbi:MAG: hypothetical protein ACFFBD_29675 [Candidatus Hodarchaeota archaeon]
MIYRNYSKLIVEEILNELIVEREDHQFQVKEEKIIQNILLYVKDGGFWQNDALLNEKREFLIDLIQQGIDKESIEVNGTPKKRFVLDLDIKYVGVDKSPILFFSIESERHELNPSNINQVVLRRQERIIEHEESMSWTFPGLISKVSRVNNLRPLNDIPTKNICGSRVDLDNGESHVSGGLDVFEFQSWGEKPKVPEISLKKKRRFRLFTPKKSNS